MKILDAEVYQNHDSLVMSARSRSAGISVSIIEHDPHTSETLSDWIRPTNGFNLINYHNSLDSALNSLPKEKPAVVLIDLNMPGKGACKCVRQLKPLLQQTQFVLLMPTDAESDGIFSALAAGATGYVLTDTPRGELLAALKHIHAGGSPMSSSIAAKVLQSFETSQPPEPASELSPREYRILRLLARGFSHNDAATTLHISLPMVSTYIRSIYEKLHIHSTGKIAE